MLIVPFAALLELDFSAFGISLYALALYFSAFASVALLADLELMIIGAVGIKDSDGEDEGIDIEYDNALDV